MAYVRIRGNQLAIVRGERDSETKEVRQQVLFTIYSQEEALAILGKKKTDPDFNFESLLEHHCDGVSFDWKHIRKGVAENLHHLPEKYEYHRDPSLDEFRDNLASFVRSLEVADPDTLTSSADVLRSHVRELSFVKELIDWRLEQVLRKRDEPADDAYGFDRDNAFHWRARTLSRDLPMTSEEMATDYYERHEYDQAEPIFRLLVDAFPTYADGWNYLGLMALDQEQYDRAIEHFTKTVEVGKRRLPRRLPKKSTWSHTETRPYLRGLINLALAYNQVGRHHDAIAIADNLTAKTDCDIEAQAIRAMASLLLGRWGEAYACASALVAVAPTESVVAGIAAFERGDTPAANAHVLHATIHYPRTMRRLAGLKETWTTPTEFEEVEDHNFSISSQRDLRPYLAKQGKPFRQFLTGFLARPDVKAWSVEIADVTRRWHADRTREDRTAFLRMNEMREFAWCKRQVGAGPEKRRPRATIALH